MTKINDRCLEKRMDIYPLHCGQQTRTHLIATFTVVTVITVIVGLPLRL